MAFGTAFGFASEEEFSISEQVDQLVIGQIAPLSQWDPRQADIHNPRTLKLRHFIAKVLAHATDLAV